MRRLGCERGGALEEGSDGRQSAARLRPSRGTLELCGDVLVRHGRRQRPVPRAAIRVDFRIGRFRQGSVDVASLLQPGGSVDGRANQGMTEHHSGAELQQAFRFDGFRDRLGDSELLRRPPNECRVAHRISCREEQQASRVTWKTGQPPGEALLDARGQRHRRGQTKPARELCRRQPARQLQQGERVPAGLDDDPLQHVLIERSWQDRLEQRPRVTTPQGLDVKLRQTGERVAQLPCREHERDLLRQEATRHKGQGARGRAVEPLRVVDDTGERLLLGGLGQQAEDRQSDQEADSARAPY